MLFQPEQWGLVYWGEEDGVHFWFTGDSPSQDIIRGVARHESQEVFKEDAARAVYRFGDALIKLNKLPHFRNRLTPWCFGHRELQCHCEIQSQTNLSVPNIYAYFVKRTWYGLHAMDGVAVEYLAGYKELAAEDVVPAAKMLVSLYRKGIYHPDMHRRNIMKEEGDIKLTDLKAIRFFPTRELGPLLMAVNHYADASELGPELTKKLRAFVLEEIQKDYDLEEKAYNEMLDSLASRKRTSKECFEVNLPQGVKRILAGIRRIR